MDLKWSYHHAELEKRSCQTATFRLCQAYMPFSVKKLMFGITSPPELNKHMEEQILQGWNRVHNISFDIIVHGRNVWEHDEKLNLVMQHLREGSYFECKQESGWISKIEFVGHILSEKRIAPTKGKVTALLEAREPVTASEVRCCLGLVNFCLWLGTLGN